MSAHRAVVRLPRSKQRTVTQSPAAPAPLIVTLSDDVLSALSRRGDVISQFPFMRISKPKGSGCKCNMNSESRSALKGEYMRVKNAIMSLSPEKRVQFKTLIKAGSAVLFVSTPNGVQRVDI